MRNIIIALWLIGTAANAAHGQDHPKLTGVPAGKPDKAISCQAAKDYILNTSDDELNFEGYNANMATFQKCKAEALSKNNQQSGSPKRILATGSYDPDRRVMVFGLISVDPNDAEGIKQVCSAIATTVGLATSDPDIVSAAGSIGCNSYVDAALKSDPLLIIAPTLVPGISITKDVLKAVGVPEKTINDAEQSIRDAASKGSSAAVQAGVGAATGGMVQVDPEVRCVSAFGHRVCR